MLEIKRLFYIFSFFTFYLISKDCNAQKINLFDGNNKRTGTWKKYHSNKIIRYTGQFKDGKEFGVFKFYDRTTSRKPVIIKKFYENSDSLFVQFYSLNGNLKTEGVLNERKRVGLWKYFYKNGDVMSQENYKNGLQHGEQFVFYSNGKITERSLFKDGLLDGISSKYSSKGILIEEVVYNKGKPNGLAKYFELNGNIKETGIYADGKRVGKWEYYLEGEIVTDDEKKKNKATFIKKKEN
ncbi:MAG: toxin-antitoxin system YwqK family antitoxin [Polaribacter sp.]|jgi:antitoxin component YwqK of YwqJK toxin-antitoxin module